MTRLLLDGTTPVKVLRFDDAGDLGVLVAHEGTRFWEWVAPGRLVAYGDAGARPEWLKRGSGLPGAAGGDGGEGAG